MKTAEEKKIEKIVAPIASALGFELVQVRLLASGRRTLQIMAERPDGTMTIEDCARLSREISALMDVEDPITGEYLLEVSSPGIDRPLTRQKDFERFKGFDAKLETLEPIDERRRFKGLLLGVKENRVEIDIDGTIVSIPFDAVSKAKLIMTDALLKAHGA